jgi:hypothetical protein
VRSIVRTSALVLGAVVLALQLVPYGRDHRNPLVVRDAPWASAEGRRLAVAACYDCHSNETRWPWYSHIAPVSWLVQRDVERGRAELNFSTWDGDADDLADAVEDGEMPPRNYTFLHPDARLSAEEKAALIRELGTLEGDAGRGGSNRGRG